ncbi:hypothetical protein J3F84DRAFT_261643 [Trichoderma pleuroticola]
MLGAPLLSSVPARHDIADGRGMSYSMLRVTSRLPTGGNMNTERGTAWFVHRSTMQLLVRPQLTEQVYTDTHTDRERYYISSLIFGSIKRSRCYICPIPWSSGVRQFTSGYFCLYLCGFGPEGCETVRFERSRFGSWRSAVPWHAIPKRRWKRRDTWPYGCRISGK